VPYVVPPQRVVLAEDAAILGDHAVLADGAVLAPGGGLRTTGAPPLRRESSAHSTRAVPRSVRRTRAQAGGPWSHPAARCAAICPQARGSTRSARAARAETPASTSKPRSGCAGIGSLCLPCESPPKTLSFHQ